MPHAIADYDTDLIQLNVWTGTKWVNIFDGNDMKNMSIDLHRVAKVVEDQVLEIDKAVKRANEAMDQANKAVDDSNVNKTAIDSVNQAATEAKQSAQDALDKIKSLASSDTIKDIQKSLKDTTDNVAKIKQSQADQLKEVTGKINDAVAQAKADADSFNAKMETLTQAVKDAQGDITAAKQTAQAASVTAVNAQNDAATAVATAKQVTVDMKNVQNDILAAKATASEATITAGNAASDAITAKTTASAASVTATDAKSDVAEVKATAQSISSRMSAVESDTDKRIAANSTAIEQNKSAITLKADQSSIDKLDSEMSSVTAQLEVQAGQISSKAESTELKKVSDKADSAQSDAQAASTKADSAIASAAKNTTAIAQNSKAIALKADQTTVDKINKTATDNSAAVNVLNNEIKLKVDSTTVNKMIDDKGFTTAKQAQALVDQSATKLSSTITELKTTVDNNGSLINSTNDRLTNVTQAIDGLQTTVKDKANQSQVTQLANALQIKMTGATIANASDVTLTYTGKDNEYPPAAPLVGMNDVDKGSTLILSFDYVASDDTKLTPQLDGTPWVPWGTIANATDVKKGEKGTYRAEITVNDNSWQKGDAKNVCIRCDGFKGTIEITNLVLKYADTVHDVQSTFDMLRDDINLRVTKGDLLSQINIAAGHTLIQSNKIYLDADSVVFGENSTAFIPSAYITDINADKITSGTLDASQIRVINLTADNIQGGTLDVGNMDVKNFSADDIVSGTLRGITFEAGNPSNGFIIDGNGIDWHRKVKDSFGGMQDGHSKIGYFSDGEFDWGQAITGSLSITDSNEIRLSLDSIVGESTGPVDEISHMPKIILTKDDTIDPRADRHKNGSLSGMQQITLWTSGLEYMQLTRHKGFDFNLDSTKDDGMGRNWAKASQFRIQKDDCVGAYFGKGTNGDEIDITAFGGTIHHTNLTVNAQLTADSIQANSLRVTGYKHNVIKTTQGYVGINAYETAEYYFGDIGENTTDENGQVVVGIDKIFGETVNTTIPYQVFITPYSDCHIWVETRYDNRFVVKSDQPNAKFGWELKAKRKGYESDRLRHIDGIKEKEETKI